MPFTLHLETDLNLLKCYAENGMNEFYTHSISIKTNYKYYEINNTVTYNYKYINNTTAEVSITGKSKEQDVNNPLYYFPYKHINSNDGPGFCIVPYNRRIHRNTNLILTSDYFSGCGINIYDLPNGYRIYTHNAHDNGQIQLWDSNNRGNFIRDLNSFFDQRNIEFDQDKFNIDEPSYKIYGAYSSFDQITRKREVIYPALYNKENLFYKRGITNYCTLIHQYDDKILIFFFGFKRVGHINEFIPSGNTLFEFTQGNPIYKTYSQSRK